jgi:hypothetical protein
MPSNKRCPGCWEEPSLVRKPVFEDVLGRPWHIGCAGRALAQSHRTPLSPEEETEMTSFEVVPNESASPFEPAPHSMRLREIIFPEDAEVGGVFVGSYIVASGYGQGTFRGKDLPGCRLVIDRDLPLGVPVTVQIINGCRAPFKVLGQRRPENQRPAPAFPHLHGVNHLRTEVDVEPGEEAKLIFAQVAPYRSERISCDDWEGWVVSMTIDGKLCRVKELTGPVTEMTSYEVKHGEQVHVTAKNIGSRARKFDARVYGMLRV